MASPHTSSNPTKARIWTGRALSSFAVLFLVFDGVGKLMRPKPVVDGFAQLGIPLSLSMSIGIIVLTCTTLYVIPRTAILGAVLLTGFLGGAVAVQLRVGAPIFSDVFPVLFGALAWGGLWLRDARLRGVFAT